MKKDLMDFEIKMAINRFLTLDDVREELRLLADSMSTHKALADKIGISPQYLHDILAGNRMPGEKVLAFLKLQRKTVYVEEKQQNRDHPEPRRELRKTN